MHILVLFDIDGTLIRDGGASGQAFDQAFGDLFGIPGASARVDKHGRTDLKICRDTALAALGRDLEPDELEQLQEHYLDLLPNALAASKTYAVLPGVSALCRALDADDRVLMGLQTGNLEPAAWAKLQRGGLGQYFSFGGFGSDSPERHALVQIAIDRGQVAGEVDPGAIYVVGDAPGDIRAGRRNNARTVAVGTGILGLNALKPLQPDYLLNDLSDMNRFKSILGLMD